MGEKCGTLSIDVYMVKFDLTQTSECHLSHSSFCFISSIQKWDKLSSFQIPFKILTMYKLH